MTPYLWRFPQKYNEQKYTKSWNISAGERVVVDVIAAREWEWVKESIYKIIISHIYVSMNWMYYVVVYFKPV